MVSKGWGKRRIEEKGFLDQLRKLGAPSSALLAGPEILLRDALLAEIERAVLGGQKDGRWNREVLGSRETPLSSLAASLRNIGLFAETRCVIVHEVERYGRSGKADRSDLWEWMEHPSPGIHLVLVSQKALWELERANQFTKGLLQRADVVVRLDHPTAERAVELIRRMATEKYDFELPEESARRLVDAVGPNLLDLSHELDRLGLRLGPGGKAEPKILENWLRSGIVGGVQDLERAILAGDRRMALRYWETVRRQFAAPAITWMLGGKHLDPRWGRGRRGPAATGGFLSLVLRECYRLELDVKSGRIPSNLQETAFEEMIWKLCAARSAVGGGTKTQ
jgi:DNA polymerase III delta subunit